MAREVEQEFVRAAHALAKTAPQAWKEFVDAYSAYVDHACQEAVRASVETALVAHGRGQAHLALRETFRTLDKRMEDFAKVSGRSR